MDLFCRGMPYQQRSWMNSYYFSDTLYFIGTILGDELMGFLIHDAVIFYTSWVVM